MNTCIYCPIKTSGFICEGCSRALADKFWSGLQSGAPSQGVKHDSDKPDLSLVSRELMESLARVRMFGCTDKKPVPYPKNNWKKGFKLTRSCAAALRHIFAFLSGETNDPESGLPHLSHAVASLEHAIYDMTHHPENDDRGSA